MLTLSALEATAGMAASTSNPPEMVLKMPLMGCTENLSAGFSQSDMLRPSIIGIVRCSRPDRDKGAPFLMPYGRRRDPARALDTAAQYSEPPKSSNNSEPTRRAIANKLSIRITEK